MLFPINREISKRVTPLLIVLGLSPNAVTGLCLAAGLLGAWSVLGGGPRGWLFGALWLQTSYVLDNCDGEIARITGRISGLGSWLDTAADYVIHSVFFFCLGWALRRTHPYALTLGFLAVLGVFLTYAAFILEQVQLRGREALRHPDPPFSEKTKTMAGKVRMVLREDFSLVVLALALFGQMEVALWGATIGFFGAGVTECASILLRGARRVEGSA